MPKKQVKKQGKKTVKKQRIKPARKIPPGASPISGVVPPPEHRFKPGVATPGSGRKKNAGLTLKEYLNSMAGYSEEELVAVLKRNSQASVVKMTAARMWLYAALGGETVAGKPHAGEYFDRIMDRTIGKPQQGIELTGKDGGAMATANYDMNKLTTAQLVTLKDILAPATITPEAESETEE